MTLPKVIIVGEAPLSANLSGTGQTIYNLFLNFPSEKVFSYVPKEKMKLFGKTNVNEFFSIPFRNKVDIYDVNKIPQLRNRLGIYLNSFISKFNLQWLQWFGPSLSEAVMHFKPELVLICPNEEEGMLEGYMLAKQLRLPFVIYFMDDWMHLSRKKWLGNDTQTLTFKVLSESVGWVIISKQLKDLLAKRYNLSKDFCVAHNPVALKPYVVPLNKGTKKRLVYAGSIWPMHYDSLVAIAESVYMLRQEGVDIELVIYSFEHFWKQFQNIFIPLEVTFGGRVNYGDLLPHLHEADLLLVTSTFGEQYKSHTLSSLQTKVTDYMMAGRAILACGPCYSACNLFVKEWQCGITCETNQPEKIKNFLLELFNNQEHLVALGKRGYQIAKDHFNTNIISSRLYDFLENSRSMNIGK